MTQGHERSRAPSGRRWRFVVAAALVAAALGLFAIAGTAQAAVVSGPTVVVSLDTSALSASPAWTSLPTIAISELATDGLPAGQVGVTFVLRAPAGWEFRPGIGQVFASMFLADITSESIDVSASQVTITLTTDDVADAFDGILIADLGVRPTTTTPTTGTVFRPAGAEGGTAVIAGVVATASTDGAGGTSFASLTSVVDAPVTLAVQTLNANSSAGVPTTALSAGTPFAVRLRALDQFGNLSPAAGDATVLFSTNAGGAPDGTFPTIPAAATSNFAAGVATVTDLVLTNAEAGPTVTATVSESGASGIASGAAGTSAEATVSPGPVGEFVIEKDGGGEIGSVPALTPFSIQITARDAYRNPSTSGPNNFSGADCSVVLTSNVVAVGGLGVTPPSVDGRLTNHTVTLAEPSTAAVLTVTGLDGSGSSGSSSLFIVESVLTPVLTVPGALTVIAELAAGTANPDQLGLVTAFLATASARDALDGSVVPVTNNAPSFFPIGTTAVEFRAVDRQGALATASVGVTVISVPTALAQLDQHAVALNLYSSLERDLRSKIAGAGRYVDQGRLDRAMRKLDDFEDQVRDESGRRIAATDAVALLTDAQRIEDVLSLARGSRWWG